MHTAIWYPQISQDEAGPRSLQGPTIPRDCASLITRQTRRAFPFTIDVDLLQKASSEAHWISPNSRLSLWLSDFGSSALKIQNTHGSHKKGTLSGRHLEPLRSHLCLGLCASTAYHRAPDHHLLPDPKFEGHFA